MYLAPAHMLLALSAALSASVLTVATVAILMHLRSTLPLNHRVLIRFRDPAAPAVVGVLHEKRGRYLLLYDTTVIDAGGARNADGRLYVPVDTVLFLQDAGD